MQSQDFVERTLWTTVFQVEVDIVLERFRHVTAQEKENFISLNAYHSSALLLGLREICTNHFKTCADVLLNSLPKRILSLEEVKVCHGVFDTAIEQMVSEYTVSTTHLPADSRTHVQHLILSQTKMREYLMVKIGEHNRYMERVAEETSATVIRGDNKFVFQADNSIIQTTSGVNKGGANEIHVNYGAPAHVHGGFSDLAKRIGSWLLWVVNVAKLIKFWDRS